MSNPKNKKRNQRILMAIIGTIAAAAAIVPMGLGLLQALQLRSGERVLLGLVEHAVATVHE